MLGFTCPLSQANELDSLYLKALDMYIRYLDNIPNREVPDKYYIRMVDLPVELNLEEHPRLKEYPPGYINGAIYRNPESTYECDSIEYIYSLVGINGNEITIGFFLFSVGLTEFYDFLDDIRFISYDERGEEKINIPDFEGVFYTLTSTGWKIDKEKSFRMLCYTDDDEDDEEDEDE